MNLNNYIHNNQKITSTASIVVSTDTLKGSSMIEATNYKSYLYDILKIGNMTCEIEVLKYLKTKDTDLLAFLGIHADRSGDNHSLNGVNSYDGSSTVLGFQFHGVRAGGTAHHGIPGWLEVNAVPNHINDNNIIVQAITDVNNHIDWLHRYQPTTLNITTFLNGRREKSFTMECNGFKWGISMLYSTEIRAIPK